MADDLYQLKFGQKQHEKLLTFSVPETKRVEFANSIDPDEVTHNEPPHLDLNCLPSSL